MVKPEGKKLVKGSEKWAARHHKMAFIYTIIMIIFAILLFFTLNRFYVNVLNPLMDAVDEFNNGTSTSSIIISIMTISVLR